jgi:hypothetical protein
MYVVGSGVVFRRIRSVWNMIVGEILFGLLCIAWGGGMLYYARAKNIPPPFVRPFVSTRWIKSDAVNRAVCAVLGLGTVISGLVFILAGLTGRHIPPAF